MALNLRDRIYTECVTVGTGNLDMGGIKDGYQDWTAFNDGDDVYYCVVDDFDWEVGQGVYIAGTNEVTRDKIFDSSRSGAKLDLDGYSSVFATYPAEKAVILDTDGNLLLPDAIIEADILKADTVNAERVNSPVIFTSAVLVDDDGDGSDEGMATALNVYTKPEVDAQQDAQDVVIDQNTKDISAVSTRVSSAENDIIELEQEIEAIAPSFERGEWDFEDPSYPPAEPLANTYYLLNAAGEVELDYADAHKIVFSNTDVNDDVHTWSDIEVGQYLEAFDDRDSEFLLAKVDAIQIEPNYASFEISVIKSDGGPRGDGDDDEAHRIRVKFFNLAETELNLDGYMPKAGGTFTGEVKHKKDIIIEPTMPNRFVTIKNRYATNTDGSDAGAGGTAFGLSFDLDHGNSGYNQVKFTNRSGNILAVNGGSTPAVKYHGRITDTHHLVTKEYVDNHALHTLHSGGNTFKFNSSSNAPNDNYFTTVSSLTSSNKEWHFKNLWDYTGGSIQCKNYQATVGSTFELWEGQTLLVKTVIKDWKTSTRGNTSMMFNCAGYKPTIYGAVYLDTNKIYSVILTNMKKK